MCRQTLKINAARITLLARVVVGLMLVSGASVAVATHLTVVHGATTGTSSTTGNYVVSTDKPNYTGTATILVNGIAPSIANAVTVEISNQAGVGLAAQPVAVRQDDSFSASFQAGGAGWNASGKYTVLVVVQQQDTVAAPITFSTSFDYTAVATTTTNSLGSTPSQSSSTNGGNSSSVASILAIVAVIVVAIGLVGFMLRSRGRGRPRTAAGKPPQK